MAADVENFPPFIQWIIYAGTAIGTAIAVIIGGRKRKHTEDNDGERERERLKKEVAELVRKDDRNQTNHDIEKMRREFTQVIEAARSALELRIDNKLSEQRRDIVNVIDDKLRHSRGRSQE